MKYMTKHPRGYLRKVMVVESKDEDETKDLENISSSLDKELAPYR